jgi:hypothetical protein
VSVGSRIIVVGTARNDVNGLSGIATGFDQQGGGSSSDGRYAFVVTSSSKTKTPKIDEKSKPGIQIRILKFVNEPVN